ncbi:flavin monoamine oxidase family protein [Rhodovibrio salinarum]|uniref:flavin monoamine oxidase family protein n=1 Tax=Rhodovibrio salinarum TaxID=1087 RepID=UPI000561C6DE|nr:NAD(P)/FAD-dependent oxidoreductase [Rhodovibrio salinarum]
MSDLPSEVDLAIVGAGVAGLAAAKTARARGLSVAVLEAQTRTGGRAFTDALNAGDGKAPLPWDRGCHWLHQARENPFTEIADSLGFRYRKSDCTTRIWLGNRWADNTELAERWAAAERAEAAVAAAARSGHDVAMAEVMPDLGRWDGIHRQFLRAMTGEDPAATSAVDDHRYKETDDNWPVEAGFGALIAAWAAELPVATATPVRRLDRTGADLRLETDRGILQARTAILTPSTNVLLSGDLRVDPALPGDLLDTLDGVPLGAANKVALAFDRDVFGLDHALVAHQPDAPRGCNFQIRPFGRDMAVAYTGGPLARELEQTDPAEMTAFAVDQLVAMFGSDVRRHLVSSATTAWGRDPWIRGSYTVCRPGRADARERLLQPVEDRIWLAGEACSLSAFGTVRGAYASGTEAARQAAASLSRANGA